MFRNIFTPTAFSLKQIWCFINNLPLFWTEQPEYMETLLKYVLQPVISQIYIKFAFSPSSWSVSFMSGVSCTTGGDAGDHQAAGGGPVSGPTPQRSVWSWAQRLQANEWGTQKESCRIPAENPKGIIVPFIPFTECHCLNHVEAKLTKAEMHMLFVPGPREEAFRL